MKKVRFLAGIVCAALLTAAAMAFAGCGGASTEFSIDADGNYSFVGDGSNYVIQIYEDTEVEDGTPVTGAESIASVSISAADGETSGTLEELVSCPFGGYYAFLYSIDSSYQKSLCETVTLTRSGTLTAPEMSYSIKGWVLTATLSTDSYDYYLASEAVTDYVVEVYGDEACSGTQLATATISGSGISVDDDSVYSGNSAELTVEGELGTDSTFYVRTKATADSAQYAEESAYGEVVSLTSNGLYADRDVTLPDTATVFTQAGVYELEEFYHVEESTDSSGNTSSTYYNLDLLLTVSEDGSYELAQKDHESDEDTEYTVTETGVLYLDENGRTVYFAVTDEEGNVSVAQGYVSADFSEITLLPVSELEVSATLKLAE